MVVIGPYFLWVFVYSDSLIRPTNDHLVIDTSCLWCYQVSTLHVIDWWYSLETIYMHSARDCNLQICKYVASCNPLLSNWVVHCYWLAVWFASWYELKHYLLSSNSLSIHFCLTFVVWFVQLHIIINISSILFWLKGQTLIDLSLYFDISLSSMVCSGQLPQ